MLSLKSWKAVLVVFFFGVTSLLLPGVTAKAVAAESAPAAAKGASEAGANAGTATAAGISTGTIAIGVVAAAVVAGAIAANGGGGGAVSTADQTSAALNSLKTADSTLAAAIAKTATVLDTTSISNLGTYINSLSSVSDAQTVGVFLATSTTTQVGLVYAQLASEGLTSKLTTQPAGWTSQMWAFYNQMETAYATQKQAVVALLQVINSIKSDSGKLTIVGATFLTVSTTVELSTIKQIAALMISDPATVAAQSTTYLTAQHSTTVTFTTIHHPNGVYTTVAHY